jgi:hypothetical protein
MSDESNKRPASGSSPTGRGQGEGAAEPHGQFLVYPTQDGRVKIEVRLENETVWLTQQHMADLFQTTKQNVSLHLQNIFAERELERGATVKESLTVQQEGERSIQRRVEFYNLDAIISVGYRVKSAVATPFKLNGFLTLNERAILNHAGKISHELAREMAEAEYEKFHSKQIEQSDQAGGDFDKAVKQLPPSPKPKKGRAQ